MSNKQIIFTTLAGFATLGVFTFYIYSGQNNQTSNPNQSLERFLQANNADPEIAEAYKFAMENPRNVLTTVKCYCGCLKQEHRNNRDCFINEEGGFDLMGLNCGLCIKTALLSKQMLADGKTVQEISDFVDSKYGKI